MSEVAEKPQLLLRHHLKQLKLPTFLAEYEKQAQECAQAGVAAQQWQMAAQR